MKDRPDRAAFFSVTLALAAGLVGACAVEPAVEKAAAPAPAAPDAGTRVAATSAIPWEDQVAAWKQLRHERLQRADGWLTLVGLSWLNEGRNRVGSDPESEVVLPAGRAPAILGVISLAGEKAVFQVAPGVAASSAGAPVHEIELASDRDGAPTPIEHGSLTFTLIERAGRLAVRVRDREAETLREFAGLENYPLDPAWRLEARFEPTEPAVEVAVPNAVGFEEKIRSPGHVVFALGGQEIRLLALDDTGDGRLFLVFGDLTNGAETYGGGRFLYTDPPAGGRVEVDFNRAYNPPCVFTPYATCPLPPRGNRLPVAVRAGEKKYEREAAHAAPPRSVAG